MSKRDDYVSLICRLPSAGRLFLDKLPPLSRLKLEPRLKNMLDEQDYRRLQQVESIWNWRLSSTIENTDEVISKQAKKVYQQLQSETLRTIVRDKLELRTCIAALRRKALGQAAPNHTNWGFGRWVDHINRNWNETDFSLGTVFPWLGKARQLINKRDAEALERLILTDTFKRLLRLAGQHFFDFEAVVIYVLKWNLLDRASRSNVEGSNRRFTQLVDQGLGEFADALF